MLLWWFGLFWYNLSLRFDAIFYLFNLNWECLLMPAVKVLYNIYNFPPDPDTVIFILAWRPKPRTTLTKLSFFPWYMLPSQSRHDFVCILHYQMIQTQLSPGTLRRYLSMDVLMKFKTSTKTHKPAEGITGLVLLGAGPLQPDLCADITWQSVFSYWQQPGQLLSILAHPGESDVPTRSGQHLLQSSIITWQLISSRNTSHPPLAFSYIPQQLLALLALKMPLFPTFPHFSLTHFFTKLDLSVKQVKQLLIHPYLCGPFDVFLLFVYAVIHLGALYSDAKSWTERKTEFKHAQEKQITHWSSRKTWFSWWSWFTWLALGWKREKKKTEWENWWGRTAREMTWVPLYVHIYLSAWHCAASVFCLHQTVIENDSPALLLVP